MTRKFGKHPVEPVGAIIDRPKASLVQRDDVIARHEVSWQSPGRVCQFSRTTDGRPYSDIHPQHVGACIARPQSLPPGEGGRALARSDEGKTCNIAPIRYITAHGRPMVAPTMIYDPNL